MTALKPGGIFVFTVRNPAFLDFLNRNGKLKLQEAEYPEASFWFGNKQSEHYGDTAVTEDWLNDFFSELGRLTVHGAL